VGSLAEWVGFAARIVKQLAPRQLLSVGDEGEPHLVECPDVDLGSCHYYPEKYGVPAGTEVEAGCRYLDHHAQLAARAGKPLLFGEFGIAGAARLPAYRAWLDHAVRAGVALVGPWLFAYRTRPKAWDEFTFYDDDPVADLLRTAAQKIERANSVKRTTMSALR
jgi:endo-1,4-beta-mannosidase